MMDIGEILFMDASQEMFQDEESPTVDRVTRTPGKAKVVQMLRLSAYGWSGLLRRDFFSW